jgi:hypothetical protein
MATTTHKVAAVFIMAVAALTLAAVFASAAPHFSGVAGDTTPAATPSVADIDW